MNSIQIPDFFEEELNLFPTHTIGVSLRRVRARRTITAGLRVSVGNGRATAPDQAVYARDFATARR